MAAPALYMSRRPFGPRRPAGEPTWGATAAAMAITVLLVLLMATALGDPYGFLGLGERAQAAPSAPPERVTWVDAAPRPIPEPAPAAGAPAARPVTPVPAAAPTVRAPAVPGTTPRAAAPPAVVAPRDSAPGRVTAPLTTPSRLPPLPPEALPGRPTLPSGGTGTVRIPPPGVCTGPCVGGAAGGLRAGPPPLDSAGRAERLREIEREVPARARLGGRSPDAVEPAGDRTRPQPMGGVSIPVGLPGGGPSAEERRRTRELDAQVSAGLARVRTRVDSLARADSLRRLDSLRRMREPPPAPR